MLNTEIILTVFVNIGTATITKHSLALERPAHIVQRPKLELVQKIEI